MVKDAESVGSAEGAVEESRDSAPLFCRGKAGLAWWCLGLVAGNSASAGSALANKSMKGMTWLKDLGAGAF
jgi:hypothetical protein